MATSTGKAVHTSSSTPKVKVQRLRVPPTPGLDVMLNYDDDDAARSLGGI